MDLFYRNKHLTKRYSPERYRDFIKDLTELHKMYNRINALNPQLVIDVGCGRNYNKNSIKNLIGFDAMTYPEADIHCPILEAPFKPLSADAIIAYSVLQMLNEEYKIQCYEKIISWVKYDGLLEMRANIWDDQEYYGELDESIDAIHGYTNKFNLEYVVEPWINTLYKKGDDIKEVSKKLGITNDKIFRDTPIKKSSLAYRYRGNWPTGQHRQIYWTWKKPNS